MKNERILTIGKYGWADFHVNNIPEFSAGYLTDIPLDLLTAIYEYKSNIKDCVSVFLDIEGSFATLVVNPYDVFFILAEDEDRLYRADICVGEFINSIFRDIEEQIDDVYSWMSCLEEEDDKEMWLERKKNIDDLIEKIKALDKTANNDTVEIIRSLGALVYND